MKTTVLALLAILIFTLNVTSCDDFFSSGLGNSRSYRAENINVTASTLDRWFDRSVGNPALARQVSIAILKKLDDPNLSPEDKVKFQRFGVKIAVESSNLGIALLSNVLVPLADVADRIDHLTIDEMERLLKDILSGVQKDFSASGGTAAARDIANIVKRDVENALTLTDGEAPRFTSGSYFAAEASPSEVGQAILALTLAQVENSGINVYNWDSFDLEALDIGLNLSPGGDRIVIDGDPDPEALVLAAYLNLVIENVRFGDNFLTSLIRDTFFGS